MYDEADQKAGVIKSKNRKGEDVTVPIMGLAIAVVTNKMKNFRHPGEVSFVAGELKKSVKAETKSAYLIDRRS